MSWEKLPLAWTCLGCGIPASSTSSESQLGVGHLVMVSCMAVLVWAPSSSPCMESSPTQPRQRQYEPSHQCKTPVKIYLYSVLDKSLQAGGGFCEPPWLLGFRPFHSVPRCSFPFCLFCCQQLPRARGGDEKVVQGRPAPHPTLSLGTPVSPSCSRLGVGACGCKADRLVARLVILFAVVHPRQHCQDEGLRDQQLHIHLL